MHAPVRVTKPVPRYLGVGGQINCLLHLFIYCDYTCVNTEQDIAHEIYYNSHHVDHDHVGTIRTG